MNSSRLLVTLRKDSKRTNPAQPTDYADSSLRRGHFGRALEEAIQSHSSQWPPAWNSKNPLHGGGNFANMTPVQRVGDIQFPSLSVLT